MEQMRWQPPGPELFDRRAIRARKGRSVHGTGGKRHAAGVKLSGLRPD